MGHGLSHVKLSLKKAYLVTQLIKDVSIENRASNDCKDLPVQS